MRTRIRRADREATGLPPSRTGEQRAGRGERVSFAPAFCGGSVMLGAARSGRCVCRIRPFDRSGWIGLGGRLRSSHSVPRESISKATGTPVAECHGLNVKDCGSLECELATEVERLKQFLAEVMLDNQILREVAQKKW